MLYFPLELIQIICNTINIGKLIDISLGNNILCELCKKPIKTYIEKFGMNGMILYNDLAGLKYFVEKFDIDISTNNNYAIKWAKICSENGVSEMIKYLISHGADPDANCIKIERVNYRPYFTVRLKAFHIDNFENCIKWISFPEKIMKNALNSHLLHDWKDYKKEYNNMPNVVIRNLNIKYLDKDLDGNINENVKFVIESNQVKIHKWNSNEILPHIMPVSHCSFIHYILYMEKDGELCEINPLSNNENNEKFTISFDLGILPKKCAFYIDHFRYTSSFYNYDIPKNCGYPSIEIFGGQRDPNGGGNNVYVYRDGIIGYYSIFTHESKLEDSIEDSVENQKIISDYNKFIENNSIANPTHYTEREKLVKRIKEYGEICLPYSIF